MGAKAWEPKRARCKHCGGGIFLNSHGCWVHVDYPSMYCEIKPPRAEPMDLNDWLTKLKADMARRHENDKESMNSQCGEYNCPCHYDLLKLLGSYIISSAGPVDHGMVS